MRALLYLFALAFLFQNCQTKSNTPSNTDNRFDAKYEPEEQFFLQRAYPYETFDVKNYTHVLKEAKKQAATKGIGFEDEWTTQGPGNIGARINTIATHPTDNNTIYIGFARGGVWKTTDGGTTWLPIFDEQLFLSIGDITLDPNDPETVYVGTGDPNISGLPSIGDGVYKSTDGGDTWENIGLEDGRITSKVIVHPTNSDILYAGMMGLPFERNNDRGLYKTTDGGDTWNQVLMVSDSAGVIDLLINPTNPDILYAASWNRIRTNQESKIWGPDAKVWKTTDGGDTWTALAGGLPQSDEMGRIGLAMSSTNPDKLYALYVDKFSNLEGIYQTLDAGATWTSISLDIDNDNLALFALGNFGWYFAKIRVHPNDDDRLYVCGIDLWGSLNVDEWYQATPNWATYQVHADKHDLVWAPDGTMYLATDGGLYRSIDDGNNWTDAENIPTSQFYRVAYNPHLPNNYYGGMQDNGTSGGNAAGINEWERIYGGDGFQPAFNPTNPSIMYAESQNGNIVVSYDGGNTFTGATSGFNTESRRNWDTPYFLSSHNPSVLYTGSYRAFQGFDNGDGVDWNAISPDLTDGNIYGNSFHTISAIHQSPIDQNTLYVGTTDGNVWRSIDASNWTEITNTLPDRYVTDVKASPSFANTVYVTHSGFKYNDSMPHIHRSDDKGDTWQAIDSNLPDLPINDLYILPNTQDTILFVATDAGVYATLNAGDSWNRLGTNMPYVPVYDLDFNVIKNELIAGTYARSIMTYSIDSLLTSPVLPMDSTGVAVFDILEKASPDVTVYPSPAIDQITVEFEQKEPAKGYDLVILDAQQQIVKQFNEEGFGTIQQTINVKDLPAGHYFVKVRIRHQVISGRFVKL